MNQEREEHGRMISRFPAWVSGQTVMSHLEMDKKRRGIKFGDYVTYSFQRKFINLTLRIRDTLKKKKDLERCYAM